MIRTIFVPLAEEFSGELQLDAALPIAKRCGAHIRAVFIRPELEAIVAHVPAVIIAAGVTREAIERESRQAAAAEKIRFEAWLARHETAVDGEVGLWFATWADKVGEIEAAVARIGRVSDLVVVQRPALNSAITQRCFDAAVFEGGRPTLVVPEKRLPDLTGHPLIAWNGSLQASRAVFGAMPLLQLATRVSIFTEPQDEAENADPSELADALSTHRIQAEIIKPSTSGRSVGGALIAAAHAQQATMIVMGAYTHSRLRQSFLGGVTRHLLAHAPVPLLMSH